MLSRHNFVKTRHVSNYVDFSDHYIDSTDNCVDMSNNDIDLSEIKLTNRWQLEALTRYENKMLS